ncbi:MAG TPA: hypothetical protein VK615_04700, partial [Candidatus Binatia bacterium]|nr:hypothetical protein [Candidatus Binatia bacterium]
STTRNTGMESASSARPSETEPPLVFQTVVRLNLAAAARSSNSTGSNTGNQGDQQQQQQQQQQQGAQPGGDQ